MRSKNNTDNAENLSIFAFSSPNNPKFCSLQPVKAVALALKFFIKKTISTPLSFALHLLLIYPFTVPCVSQSSSPHHNQCICNDSMEYEEGHAPSDPFSLLVAHRNATEWNT